MTPYAIQATLTIFSNNLCDRINDSISAKGEFTTVTDSASNLIASSAISLLCLESWPMTDELNITHIAVIEKGQRVATGQNRLKIYKIIELGAISLNSLISSIQPKLRAKARNVFSVGYKKVPPKTGEELFNALIKSCPDKEVDIKHLVESFTGKFKFFNSLRNENMAAEKDAVSICLDIFGIDRARILRQWQLNGKSVAASFLKGFRQFKSYEDDLINYDLNKLPGWKAIEQSIAGYVEFENSEQEKLVIINANRKPLEKAFGVDLIYFHRKYEAFTLVQYKMMDKSSIEPHELYYNPNQESHRKELKRMQKLQMLLEKEAQIVSLNGYRFSECSLFFKLCRKLEFKPDNTSIAPGAYIPLNQWEILLNDESTRGPNDGCQIGYHTLGKRYLGTQTFIDLVQKGFIGTRPMASRKIALFIQDALESGHSVIYAVDHQSHQGGF